MCLLLALSQLLCGCDNNTGKNNKGGDDRVVVCASHNYIDGICSKCQCSLWDGTADTSWYSVLNTEFTIITAQQFAGFAQLVNNGTSFANCTVTLGVDIDLAGIEWTPIGKDDKNKFAGDFDGAGCIIYNHHGSSGLFSTISGSLTNLIASNTKIKVVNAEKINLGGLVDYCYGGKISNCHVGGTIDVDFKSPTTQYIDDYVYYKAYIGGICGYIRGGEINDSSSSCDINIISKGNQAKISGGIGGAVGAATNPSEVYRSCSDGRIDLNVERGETYIGGFIGVFGGSCRITDCYSQVKINASLNKGKECMFIGGFVAQCEEKGRLKNCYSSGDINCESSLGTIQTGGVVAAISGYISDDESAVIYNCCAIGDIVAKGGNNSSYRIATAASFENQGFLSNCFYNSDQTITGSKIENNGTPATLKDMKSTKFYTDILGWDSTVWQFKDGELPTLRQ